MSVTARCAMLPPPTPTPCDDNSRRRVVAKRLDRLGVCTFFLSSEFIMSERIVVITGASSGIGAALAQLLAARGDSPVLVARRKDALDDVARQCAGRAIPIVGDMTRREEVRHVVEATIARLGRIDVWVNNVGQGISRLP